MAVSKREIDYARHDASAKENAYKEALARLSLAKKGIKNPTPLQVRIESLWLSHKHIKNSVFLSELSDKKRGCLLLTAWGLEVKEIAGLLGIKPDTVVNMRSEISQELNATNITNTVYKASEAGILMVDNVDFILKFKDKKNNLSQIKNL